MEINYDEILSKYTESVVKNIDTENFKKIIQYLHKIKCPIIDDLVEDYLDLFTIEYNELIRKIEYLNKKYNDKFFDLAAEDLNYLEEIYENN